MWEAERGIYLPAPACNVMALTSNWYSMAMGLGSLAYLGTGSAQPLNLKRHKHTRQLVLKIELRISFRPC